ncbi:hypothetical protein NQ315_005024 [Exocentrus adspersus]|uniref:Uncharacterized protein n=1 Tax=Exocentrus adspersus TaxID=1586481 RepID=A0AAV8VQ64_9CUCU|nr:hypothetical protein NQ315_005024 [Exocentrus adspersus]
MLFLLQKRYSYDDLNIQLPRAWTLNKNIKLDIGEKPLTGQQDYKNIGTNLLVEVLTGILADSNCGPNIPIQKDSKEKNKKREPLNLGHNFIAINPEMFVPNFATRLSRFLNRLRNLEMGSPSIKPSVSCTIYPSWGAESMWQHKPPGREDPKVLSLVSALDPTKKIDLPGDKQRQHMKKVDCAGGTLCFHRTQLLALENISKRLGVPPLELSLYTQGPYEKSKGSPELDLS